MIYPEMPKSKKKMSYIVGGIFALLVGVIIFLLFLPSFLDKNFGFKPWDWTTIIPNLNSDFFGAVGFYMKLALPIILFLCAVSSLFMGLSKSGGLFKGSILASTLALILKHSLEPANLTTSMKGIMEYICFGLIGVALILAVLASIFRFLGEEPYAPYRANSFHFYASYALMLIAVFDVFAGIFGLNAIVSNVNYYLGTTLGLFLIVASIWMFCTSNRDQSEFGVGYERDAKIKAEQKGQQGAAAQGAPTPQEAQPQGQPEAQPAGAPVTPNVGPDGNPVPPMAPNAGVQPNTGVQNGPIPPQPTQPNVTPAGAPAQTAQPAGAPAQPAGIPAQPPRPAMPPRIGPDGRPLPPIPPRPMQPRIGPDGKPLPPLPPRQPMPPRIGPDGKPLPPLTPRPPMPPRPAGQPPVQPAGVPPQPAGQPAGTPVQPAGQPAQGTDNKTGTEEN